MALPQITNDIFTPAELLSGKKIGTKPWRVKEEKDLLFATEGVEDVAATRREVVKFLRRCVDNQSLFDTLSTTDYIHLAMQLRKQSKGSVIEYSYKCSACGFPLSDDVSLDKNVKTKKFDGSPITINPDLKVSIKEVSFTDYDALVSKYSKMSEYNYNYIIKSISAIVYKGEVFEEFTEAELIDFVDQLASDDYGTLLSKIQTSGARISLEKKLTCGKCKQVNEVQFGDLYHFLVL